MKTALLLLLLCTGLGFAIAQIELSQRNQGLVQLIGGTEDISQELRASAGAPESTGAITVVNGAEIDFGTMRRGSQKSHVFVFKNTGDVPVTVRFLTSSCKCTVGNFEKATLEPGESTDVELEWTAEGAGDFAQTATIGSSVRGQEEIKLTIRGNITEAISFEPPIFAMGDFLSNETHILEGRLLSYNEQPLNIDSVTISDSRLADKAKITFTPPRAPEEGEYTGLDKVQEIVDFKVEIDKGLSSGNFTTHVVFHAPSNSGTESTVAQIQLNGRCINPIRVIAGTDYDEVRDILSLGIGNTKDGLSKSFLFGVRTKEFPDANIVLKKITPEEVADFIKVTIKEPQVSPNQKLFSVMIEIPPGTPPVEYNGASGKDFVKLVFDTNMEDSPEESIYLKFLIQD